MNAPFALRGMAVPNDAEAWMPALLAFYQADGSTMRAESLAKGWAPLDGTDLRTIEALKAALRVAP